jgi:uncharacterized protein YmfQ (DUF2313 family)
MTCAPVSPTDICPSLDETHRQLLALLPQGRAWRTRQGGPEPGSVLWSFWRAAARAVQALEARACALRLEFWCESLIETRPEWLTDYGLPDACDPFPDLCAKVAAIGGQTCDYFVALAAQAGWAIACVPDLSARAGCFQAGCGAPGPGDPQASLRIAVDLAGSPAYGGKAQRVFQAGCSQAGNPLACGPDMGPLICILSRVLPAHLIIIYEAI